MPKQKLQRGYQPSPDAARIEAILPHIRAGRHAITQLAEVCRAAGETRDDCLVRLTRECRELVVVGALVRVTIREAHYFLCDDYEGLHAFREWLKIPEAVRGLDYRPAPSAPPPKKSPPASWRETNNAMFRGGRLLPSAPPESAASPNRRQRAGASRSARAQAAQAERLQLFIECLGQDMDWPARAERTGVKLSTLRGWCRRWPEWKAAAAQVRRVKPRGRRAKPLFDETRLAEFKELLVAGLSLRKIAARLSVNYSALVNRVNRASDLQAIYEPYRRRKSVCQP